MVISDIQLEAFLIWEKNQHLSPEECWYQAEQIVNQKCNLDLQEILMSDEVNKIEKKKCCGGKKGCSNG